MSTNANANTSDNATVIVNEKLEGLQTGNITALSVLTRVNPIVTSRKDTITNNLLALAGGEPYIHARLSRFPAETDIDFLGDHSKGVEGRRNRAYLYNYAARIIGKISQYVFQKLPLRTNVPDDFIANASSVHSLNDFIIKAFQTWEACGWCWIKVDAPSSANAISIADAEDYTPYLSLYSPLEVVDWNLGKSGIEWLITELAYDESYVDAPHSIIERTLYTPLEITRFKIDKKSKEVLSSQTVPNPIGIVPFVLVGVPSSDPWYFDDVERINKSIMDLESAFDNALFRSVYPQLIVPADLIRTITEQRPNTSYDAAVAMIIGMNYPIMETMDSKGVTRYIAPPTTDLESLRRDINERKLALFELLGIVLHLQDTKQVASAEAKAFDYLDLLMVLREKATKLEIVENKIYSIAKAYDARFMEATVEYNRLFNVEDPTKIFDALISAKTLAGDNPEVQKLISEKAVKQLSEM